MITADDLFTEDLETFEDDTLDELNNVNVQEEGENEDETSKQPVKPRKVIRNPQPKLNAETLKGKRGLGALESYFENVQVMGVGHEEQDLGIILKTYEYWCHRLFPKYPFDECITKIEALGKKKPVITHIKKIRANLIFDDEPLITNDIDSDEETSVNQFDSIQIDPVTATPPNVSEEQLTRMNLNMERARRIRQEKLRREKELSESFSQEPSTSQMSASPANEKSSFDTMISQTAILDTHVNSQGNTENTWETSSQSFTHTSQMQQFGNNSASSSISLDE